jgi:hypothetical protein
LRRGEEALDVDLNPKSAALGFPSGISSELAERRYLWRGVG